MGVVMARERVEPTAVADESPAPLVMTVPMFHANVFGILFTVLMIGLALAVFGLLHGRIFLDAMSRVTFSPWPWNTMKASCDIFISGSSNAKTKASGKRRKTRRNACWH